MEYAKNKAIDALPETIGIAIFDTMQNARNFINVDTTTKILKVKAMGKEKKLEKIAYISASDGGSGRDSTIKLFLSGHRGRVRTPPKGSIFYPAIKVLD